MKNQRKAIAAGVVGLAAVLATYIATGELDQAGLEAAISALVTAGVGYGLVYLLPNNTED